MSFREKSAWVMAAVTVVAGILYANMAVSSSQHPTEGALPLLGVLIAYTILLVIGSIVAQTTLASMSPKEAGAAADERERPILDRAGNWSGLVLGGGAVTSLLAFLLHRDATLLFHSVMGSLIVSQVAEYGFQIALLRRSA